MRFDVNRLSKLAGLPGGNDRRSLNEASNRSYHEDPAVSDEAAYRYGNGQLSEKKHGKKEGHGMMKHSMMEKEDVPEGTHGAHAQMMDEKYYEEGHSPEHIEEMGNYKEGAHDNKMGKHMEEMGNYKEGAHDNKMGKHMEEGGHEQAEAVYEIDEADLVSELRRLRVMTKINNTKKRQQRQKALQEAQLRQIIEEEVDNVFKDLENGKLDLNISGDWVYGNSKPRNSRRGRIARGFKSIGFK
jgi:hypothetical protein